MLRKKTQKILKGRSYSDYLKNVNVFNYKIHEIISIFPLHLLFIKKVYIESGIDIPFNILEQKNHIHDFEQVSAILY